MATRIAKFALFAAVIATVGSAGAVSVRQLTTTPKPLAICRGGTCSATVHCPGVCFCNLQPGQSVGFCTQDPIGVKPASK